MVASSKDFKELLEILIKQRNMKIKVFEVNGNHTMKDRKKIFKEFTENKLSIMVSARVLNEGVNIPIIDSICFVDARTSTTDIIQCAGRSLRLHEGKTKAKLYIPIMIEDIETIDEKTVFGNIIRILRCLSETDTDITEYFIAVQNGKTHNRALIKHVNYMGIEKIGEDINVDDWMNGIDIKIWQRVDGFEYKFNETEVWISKNKRVPGKDASDPIEKKLGGFCAFIRIMYVRGELSPYRIGKFQSLEVWYWDKEDVWDQTLDKIKAWKQLHGIFPKTSSKNVDEAKLGKFLVLQRLHKREKTLSEDRIKKLNEVDGFDWGKDEKKAIMPLDDTVNELEIWVKNNGKIPRHGSNVDETEKRLGLFCNNRRSDNIKNKLSDEQKVRLSAIPGWYWNLEDKWDETFEKTKLWVIHVGYIPKYDVNSNDSIQNQLGKWCSHQRNAHKKKNLSPERIDKLNTISGWLW
jgi:hypothetical protein